jgi:hypothetical protein
MTLCRSRGGPGRARHGGEQVQCRVSARRLPFSQAFAAQTQFANRSKVQDHCLALEGSPLDRLHA